MNLSDHSLERLLKAAAESRREDTEPISPALEERILLHWRTLQVGRDVNHEVVKDAEVGIRFGRSTRFRVPVFFRPSSKFRFP